MLFQTTIAFTTPYASKRTVTFEITPTIDLLFGEGFRLKPQKWGNQYGRGYEFHICLFCVSLALSMELFDGRPKPDINDPANSA